MRVVTFGYQTWGHRTLRALPAYADFSPLLWALINGESESA